ncbi:MAG: integrase arm-type DNA-binding domain-containing protein, partial [Xanthomonadaceae bacterium]|nr:integrase arm-type DNA-binding domain-containing protein [Xanthomonadaceae bacterium]
MALTDTGIRKAKATDKPQKLTDGGGMYLLLNPNGSRWWRLDYRHNGKRKTLSLGTYPDTGLADARDKRDEARKLLAAGIDPSEQRKAVKLAGEERAANRFAVIAEEWLAKQAATMAPATMAKARWTFNDLVFPWIGNRPIAEIDPPEMLKLLQRIEERGAHETAHRTKQRCGQVFRYAIATHRAKHDPTSDLRGALTAAKVEHRPAITDPAKIGEL